MNSVDSIDPAQGNDVRLTLDVNVQKVAEALQQAFVDAHNAKYDNAAAGAIVCMNAKTGEVIAMASAPDYDPTEFIGGISSDTSSEPTGAKSGGYPLSTAASRACTRRHPRSRAFTGLGSAVRLCERAVRLGLQGHVDRLWRAVAAEVLEHERTRPDRVSHGHRRIVRRRVLRIAKRFYQDCR